MSFVVTWTHIILVVVGLLAGVFLARLLLKRTPSEKESIWNQAINDNSDFVTIIGLIVGAVLIFVMVMHFQDGLKSEAGYILMAALNGFFYLAGVKNGENKANK